MPNSILSTLDWVIIIVYLVLSIAVGLWYSRQGSQGFLEFVLSGRKLSWWLAGTSIVSTTFAVDTPLYVTELVRSQGIAGNWQWWCMGIGGTMGVLAITYFAARWRRAEVLTEVEFVELRYAGKSAAFLRGFKAIFFALVKNTLSLGAQFLAMAIVLKVNVGVEKPEFALWASAIIALLYTLVGGLWGVVLLDFFQFVIAMIGAFVLAWYAIESVGGISGLESALVGAGQEQKLSMLPPLEGGEGALAPILFLVYLLCTWWANPNADGGGMFVQRMAACKNEKHAVGGSLWAIFAHYVLRSWPWIMVALVSLVVIPKASDTEAYPLLINLYLPSGWRGLMFVAFLTAFMSTVSTQLNWGASVLVNDLYKRFLAKDRSDRHYVLAAQAMTVLLVCLPIFVQEPGDTVSKFVAVILGIGAGIGPALLARWFWWRANAWTEVAAIIASSVATAAFQFSPFLRSTVGSLLGDGGPDSILAGRLLSTTVFSTVVALIATYLTAPVPKQQLAEFCRRLKPIGFWGEVGAGNAPAGPEIRLWLLGIAFLFASLFSVGHLCLGHVAVGLAAFLAAGFLGWVFIQKLMGSRTSP